MFSDGNRLKHNHLMHYSWWPMSAVNNIVLLMETMMVRMTDIDDLFDTLQYYILCTTTSFLHQLNVSEEAR